MAFVNTDKDGPGAGGTSYWQLCDSEGRTTITSAWTPSLQADEALNDSDKTFTVPASTEWIVKWLWAEFTTGAGANRQIEIQIQDDAADVIAEIKAGVAQGAAITRYYLFGPHCADLAAFRDTDYLMTPMPEWYLPAGYVIRVWDNAAVLPAADDLILQMMVISRAV